eukprot:1857330-Alexandrium_andersonii.AAC.1
MRLGWDLLELTAPGGFVAAQQRILQMADIRELELQRSYRRRRAARWDTAASAQLGSSLAGDLLRPRDSEAPCPLAVAGDTAALVQLAP